jgi:hypothetical protein
MPAIAHLGVGFAAKSFAPKVPVVYLILAAEFIEIVFFAFMLVGIEKMPEPNNPPYSPYSHSLIMGLTWSIVAGLLTYLISSSKKTSLIIGLLVFSHTALDIIASPKLAFYPTDTKIPIFFDGSLSIGLGLWKNKIFALGCEFGVLILGVIIYLLERKRIKEKNQT